MTIRADLEHAGLENGIPWLEPGAGLAAETVTGGGQDIDTLQAAALVSAAITFKRLVDMLEVFAKPLAAQMHAELAETKKGKGK